MRMRLEGIPEEDHEVDPAFHDRRAHLLVPAERTAHEAADAKIELGGEEGTGGTGGVEIVLAQGSAVVPRPLEQVSLAVVVRDERDLLANAHPGTERLHYVSRSVDERNLAARAESPGHDPVTILTRVFLVR